MIKAVRFEIITVGTETYIQLYDETNTAIVDQDTYWDGDFYCSYKQITSLKGCPKEVRGSFHCSKNYLTSLEHAPLQVGNNFKCSHNQLTSREHGPLQIGGDFYCSNNQLTSLEFLPEVNGDIRCWGNKFAKNDILTLVLSSI